MEVSTISCMTFLNLAGSEWWGIAHYQYAIMREEQSAKCLSGDLGGVHESQNTKGAHTFQPTRSVPPPS